MALAVLGVLKVINNGNEKGEDRATRIRKKKSQVKNLRNEKGLLISYLTFMVIDSELHKNREHV